MLSKNRRARNESAWSYIVQNLENRAISGTATHSAIVKEPNGNFLQGFLAYWCDFKKYQIALSNPFNQYQGQFLVHRNNVTFHVKGIDPKTLALLDEEPLEVFVAAERLLYENPPLFKYLNKKINKIWNDSTINELERKIRITTLINTGFRIQFSDFTPVQVPSNNIVLSILC